MAYGDNTNQGEIEVYADAVTDQEVLKQMADLDNVGGAQTQRLKMYAVYQGYYDGDHQTELLDRARQYLAQNTGVEYAENVCDLIVDAMADRLTVKGWKSAPTSDSIVNAVNKVWDDNNMDVTCPIAISRTIELGDGFLLVDYDPEKGPTIDYNPPTIMKAEYDVARPQVMLYAVKRWCDAKVSPVNPGGDPVERMNIYYPDRIERYFAIDKGGDWIPWVGDGDTHWPIPWTRDNLPGGEPRGIPVFHLRNKSRGRINGRSELHKAIPLQDSLNKLWLDIFEIADAQGYPQRYATGLNKTADKDIVEGAGTLWTATDPAARFGQFDAADLNQLVNLVDMRYRTIAGTTYTPIHMLVLAKGIMSGEALKKSESGLVAKVKDRQPSFGHTLGMAMMMCLVLLVDNGETVAGLSDDTKLNPIWGDAENVDETERLEVAEIKRRIGIPLSIVFQELGYENVEEMMKLVEEETAKSMEMKLAEYKANRGDNGDGSNKQPDQPKDNGRGSKSKDQKNAVG